MWGEMYPGISQICGRGLGSSRRSRAGRSSHVAALWEGVAPLLPSHAGLATVVGTPHLEWGSSVSELWEEAAGRTRQWVVWCLVPRSRVVVRAMRAPWGGQGQKEDGCRGQSPYRACTRSLELIIRRVHPALPFTRNIPSQVWVLWSPLALFLSGIRESRGRCLCCFQAQVLLPWEEEFLYNLHLVCCLSFSSWKWFSFVFFHGKCQQGFSE